MDISTAIILGIVEGITEFLPISSTGHLLLVERFLAIPPSDFVTTFTIGIQLGAIFAVCGLYWRDLLKDWEVWKKIAAAFIPTALIGLTLYSIVKTYLLVNLSVIIWALLVGGIALLLAEWLLVNRAETVNSIETISYKQALMVGLFQSIALVPGVSRAAATIIGGMALGISRETIVKFSFLLAVPTMLSATALDLLKSPTAFGAYEWQLLIIGFVVAWLVAVVAIKFLLRFIERHTFVIFGIYRIVLALFLLFIL